MFDSLDEQIKADDRREVSATERYIRWGVVAISSVVLFAGLYYGVRFLE
jgi:hypothetical protein